MNSLYTCSYRCRDFAGNNVLPMILSASAFNSCMIEFSIPDFNETIIKNIISVFLSFSNTERREVVLAYRHLAEQLCTTWYLSRNLFAPLVWGSKSREWIEANVSNSKSNQKFARQMKCINCWKQKLILVFPTQCPRILARFVCMYYTILRLWDDRTLGAIRGEN